ncbi:MAG: NAD(P)H-dependent oxidoreductase [Methylococcales bacterium]
MSHMLRIDASSRNQGSFSREFADVFQENWLKANQSGKIVTRDLTKDKVPHIEENTIIGFYTPKDQHTQELSHATELSDKLISEIEWADVILISTPMYNFSVPSVLKAYIDQIVRIGQTFDFDPEKGLLGLLENKKAYIVTSSGAVFSDGSLDVVNFLSPYLKSVLGLIGITDVEIISIEGTSTDESALNRSKIEAEKQIKQFFTV